MLTTKTSHDKLNEQAAEKLGYVHSAEFPGTWWRKVGRTKVVYSMVPDFCGDIFVTMEIIEEIKKKYCIFISFTHHKWECDVWTSKKTPMLYEESEDKDLSPAIVKAFVKLPALIVVLALSFLSACSTVYKVQPDPSSDSGRLAGVIHGTH